MGKSDDSGSVPRDKLAEGFRRIKGKGQSFEHSFGPAIRVSSGYRRRWALFLIGISGIRHLPWALLHIFLRYVRPSSKQDFMAEAERDYVDRLKVYLHPMAMTLVVLSTPLLHPDHRAFQQPQQPYPRFHQANLSLSFG